MDGDGADVGERECVVVFCVFGVAPTLVDEPAYDEAVRGEVGGTLPGDIYTIVHFLEERDEFDVHVRECLAECCDELHDGVAVVDGCVLRVRLHFLKVEIAKRIVKRNLKRK